MTLIAVLRHSDPDSHEAGCMDDSRGGLYADPGRTHVDVFCDCHRYTEPKILPNGTDVAWPAGWDEEQASEWRDRNGLLPAGISGAQCLA
jgi:hypothetical protein